MKWTSTRIPVLIGPKIPRRDRIDTRDRYCRAILTLFKPWFTANDLCKLDQSWIEALNDYENKIDNATRAIINNIEALHECESDREKYLMQIIDQETTDDNTLNNNEDILRYIGEFMDMDNEGNTDLLRFIDDIDESFNGLRKNDSKNNVENQYIDNALKAVLKTKRFFPKTNVTNKNSNGIRHISSNHSNQDENSSKYYIPLNSRMDKSIQSKWLQQMKYEKNKAREMIMRSNYDECDGINNNNIGFKTIDMKDVKMKTHAIGNENDFITSNVSFFTKQMTDEIEKVSIEFKLNEDQFRAFSIIVNHMNDESHLKKGKIRFY